MFAHVRFWHKADMGLCAANVRYWGQSGHGDCSAKCPLLTQSGHATRSRIGLLVKVSGYVGEFNCLYGVLSLGLILKTAKSLGFTPPSGLSPSPMR